MEKEYKHSSTFESSVSENEAEMKKSRLVSSITEKAEQGDEEENKGRS